ncbi:MAG: hypothetical protein LQ342_006008 [Letrouitia transgressa]|nr:MAG: hypothetical protein LQ342_006008 [Letrouitia transgressa]
MADDYLLRVTAGPSYDSSTHQIVSVNTPTPTKITSTICTANISVQIQNYRGLPHNSPSTSTYFAHPQHVYDQYSISFTLIPHKSISGKSLLFGNDFDYPIRDRLPPGFSTALRIFKWAIDPGIDGDAYADKPYLYGNALSSLNVLRVGPKIDGDAKTAVSARQQERQVIEEGGYEGGDKLREDLGVPEDAATRKKWFLGEQGRLERWVWEEGRIYEADFFNPYLDFNSKGYCFVNIELQVVD